MNILSIYRYLHNYLILKISGGFIERFINLCNRENLNFWDSVYHNGTLTVKMYCRDFRKLIEIRRKSGVKIEIVEKIGIHFFKKRNSKRKVIAGGLAAALSAMLIMNNFVWSIEVTGTENLSEKEIIQTLSLSGLKYGTFVPAFDENKASRDAVNSSEGKILWLAVNIKGSKATVEVREYNNQSKESESLTPCNLIADFDGILLSSYTYRGVQVTQSGFAVKKGDMLISGISENENGTVDYLCADGEFSAVHEIVLTSALKKEEAHTAYYNQKNSYKLIFFGIDIPLYFITDKSTSENLSYREYLTFDGNVIPIGIEKITSSEKKAVTQRQYEMLELIDLFTVDEYAQFKNSRIVESDYTLISSSQEWSVSGKYSCIDFIGQKAPILKEE